MYMAAPCIRDKIANKTDKAPILVELIGKQTTKKQNYKCII